jgi:hypothetical protein
MHRFRLLWLVILPIISSCTTSINTQVSKSYPPLDPAEQVYVFDIPDDVPETVEILGKVKIGEGGMTIHCGWEEVIAQASAEARKAGGNALKITEHRLPDFISSCHRITALILKVDSIEPPPAEMQPVHDSLRSAVESSPGIQTNLVKVKKKFPHFRLSFDAGYCYRTARVPDNLDVAFEKYMKKLKSGWTIGGDAGYYFSEGFGIGIKGNYSHFSNQMSDVIVYTTTDTLTGMMADRIGITYVGPELMMRFYNAKRTNAFIMNLGIGYLGYVNDATLISDFSITGGTVGIAYDLGYDIRLTNELMIGLQASILLGTLTSVMVDDGNTKQTIDLGQDNKESLARINLTIGLRFVK